MNSPSATFLAVVPPELVDAARDELRGLGLAASPADGGVAFRGPVEHLRTASLHARLPTRLRVQLGLVPAGSLEGLSGGLRKIDWSPWVHPRQPIEITVRSGRRGPHRGGVQRKAEHAIRDALRGPRRDPGAPPRSPAKVMLAASGNRFAVSLDATGEAMFRRGWKQQTAKAPLRETLAAAVLWFADWDPDEALVDPMCGSGTLPIEAATIAAGRPPGARRRFAFEDWPCHDAKAWKAAVGRAPRPVGSAPIVGGDRDPGAIKAARANARRAGVEGRVQLVEGPHADLPAPADSGLVVSNPPYGKRVGRNHVQAAWRGLGQTLRARFVGWRVALVVPDPSLLALLGVRTERVATLPHGGIRVAVHVGRVE